MTGANPDTGPAATHTSWLVVWLVLLAGIAGAFQVGKMPGALPTLRADLGLGLVAAGWAISVFSVIGMMGGAAVGSVADRLGHRRVVLAGLIAVAAGSFIGSFASGSPALLFSRAIEGCGFIAILAAGPVLVMRIVRPRDFNLALGIWSTFMPVGMALMVLATPLFLETMGWRDMWLTNAGFALLALLALGTASRGMAPPMQAQARASSDRFLTGLKRTVTARGPLLLTVTFATYSLNFLAVHAFLPTFLIEQRGYAPALAIMLVAIPIFFNAIGTLMGSWLMHLGIARWKLMLIGHITMGISSVGIFLSGTPDSLRFTLALLLPLVGGIVPVAVIRSAPSLAAAPNLVAATNGLFNQGVSTGQLVGPPLLAALVAGTGSWNAAPILTVSAAAIGLVCALLVRPLETGRS